MACPVCSDAAAEAHYGDDNRHRTRVWCKKCGEFVITPEAAESIRLHRDSDDPTMRAKVERLAEHLASGQEPRPVLMRDTWITIAP